MAFNEGLKQKIDLIGMLQATRDREQTEEERKRQALQNQMMMEEMKQQQWRNQMEKAPDTMTVKGVGYDPRFGFGTEKKFLNDMPGMITGVSPETVFKNMGETDRAMISAMRGGYGGGGGGGQPQDPYSNYAPGQLEQMNAINDYQPQQAKPQSADLAALLGQVARPGGVQQAPPQEPSLYDKLNEEEANVAGLNSLLTQAEAKGQLKPGAEESVLSGARPVANAVDTEMQTWAQGVIDNASAGNAAKQEALNRGSKAIMSDPRFSMLGKTAKGREKQKAILANIEEIVSRDRVINLNEVFSKYSAK